jgi:hypothetical protein
LLKQNYFRIKKVKIKVKKYMWSATAFTPVLSPTLLFISYQKYDQAVVLDGPYVASVIKPDVAGVINPVPMAGLAPTGLAPTFLAIVGVATIGFSTTVCTSSTTGCTSSTTDM